MILPSCDTFFLDDFVCSVFCDHLGDLGFDDDEFSNEIDESINFCGIDFYGMGGGVDSVLTLLFERLLDLLGGNHAGFYENLAQGGVLQFQGAGQLLGGDIAGIEKHLAQFLGLFRSLWL